jgi:hypothetical protein
MYKELTHLEGDVNSSVEKPLSFIEELGKFKEKSNL